MPILLSIKEVYERLICEFRHYDICLVGLIKYKGQRCLCKVVDPDAYKVEYTIHTIVWDDECEEYLTDYREAYKHWFYAEGNRIAAYEGWDLFWFRDKWDLRNPIEEKALDQ